MNLDEVLPRANGALPMLEIHTRPMSAPPGPRGGVSKLQTAALNSARSGTSQPGSPAAKHGALAASQLRLGPRPEIDEAKMEALLDLSAGLSDTSLVLACTHSVQTNCHYYHCVLWSPTWRKSRSRRRRHRRC